MNKLIILLCAVFVVAKGETDKIQHDQHGDDNALWEQLTQNKHHDDDAVWQKLTEINHHDKLEGKSADDDAIWQQLTGNPIPTIKPITVDFKPDPTFYPSNLVAHTDDYLKLTRLQFKKILQNYDRKISQFAELYVGRLGIINVILDMIIADIVQNEKVLFPLEMLSDLDKHCINNYRPSLLSPNYTKTAIRSCLQEATNQLPHILIDLHGTRNSWEYYITNSFAKYIADCGTQYPQTLAEYTHCITNVVDEANAFAIENQKTFETQLDAAECTAKANIKRALDCSYDVKAHAISEIAKVNLLIDICVEGEVKCEPCDTCDQSAEISSEYSTLNNPFYRIKTHPDCLLLKQASHQHYPQSL